VLTVNPQLKERVQAILKTHMEEGDKSIFIQRMTKTVDGTIERSASLLAEILEGIND
jgi:hypothetical protein